MNPYERYYLRQKILKGVLGVGAAALVVGGVLLWHPWDQEEPQDVTEQPPVMDVTPIEKEEPDLTITVGGKKVSCRLYEGDGWSIPVPLDWTIEENGDTVDFIPPGSSTEGSCLSVTVGENRYTGSFISIGVVDFDGETGVERLFYNGTDRGFSVRCRMEDEDVETFEKTMTAMARVFTLGDERPFAALYPMASEPEWQMVEGDVVLFLDKDGVDIATISRTATEGRMNSWDDERKSCFTGKYRMSDPVWVASYTCVVEDYVDVFALSVEYQVKSGEASNVSLDEGQQVRNGWLSDENIMLYIAIFHDGSAVTNTATVWEVPGYRGAEFAARVIASR